MASHLDTLKEMGFSETKARKALDATDNKGVEVAMDWIMAHEDDVENNEDRNVMMEGGENVIEEEKSSVEIVDTGCSEPPMEEAKCLKCDDCGQLLRSGTDAEMHAIKFKHTNFSESTEEVKAISEEERAERIQQARMKLDEVKKVKEEEEKKKKIQMEINRRIKGKETQEAKQRQKVLDEIKRDREAKKLKNKGVEQDVPEAKPTMVSTPPLQTNYEECKLQIRLTDGSTLSHSFGAQEQLAAVRLFVEMNRTDGEGSFRFMTTFPRRVFSDEDMETPLSQLGTTGCFHTPTIH